MTSRSNVYVIGYRKPPKAHRFRKGESGKARALHVHSGRETTDPRGKIGSSRPPYDNGEDR